MGCVLLVHFLYFEKEKKSRLMISPCCLSACILLSLLDGWSKLYETWYVYHNTRAYLKGMRHKSLPSISLYMCIPQDAGPASTSNIDILDRFQSKALRMIVGAPWYVPNTVIRKDPQTLTVKEEIHRYSSQYSVRLSAHPNVLFVQPENKRLLRIQLPNYLPTRFLVQLSYL
jgi:hypothetical protein